MLAGAGIMMLLHANRFRDLAGIVGAAVLTTAQDYKMSAIEA